jgi:hypothetical protein
LNGDLGELAMKDIIKNKSTSIFENSLSMLDKMGECTIESQKKELELDFMGRILLEISEENDLNIEIFSGNDDLDHNDEERIKNEEENKKHQKKEMVKEEIKYKNEKIKLNKKIKDEEERKIKRELIEKERKERRERENEERRIKKEEKMRKREKEDLEKKLLREKENEEKRIKNENKKRLKNEKVGGRFSIFRKSDIKNDEEKRIKEEEKKNKIKEEKKKKEEIKKLKEEEIKKLKEEKIEKIEMEKKLKLIKEQKKKNDQITNIEISPSFENSEYQVQQLTRNDIEIDKAVISKNKEFALIKYFGNLNIHKSENFYVGVEWENPIGTGDGVKKLSRYFKTKSKHASFFKLDVFLNDFFIIKFK